MVKIFLILFLAFNFSFGDVVTNKIKNLMGSTQYKKKKNLINILFKKRGTYKISNTKANSVRILSKLKENGLIKLFFKYPQVLNITFSTKNENGVIFIKIVTDSLNALGYNFFLTKKMIKSSNHLIWNITLKTSNILDPVMLAKEFLKRGTTISDITKISKTKWSYQLNTKEARLISLKITSNRYIELQKPLEDYMVKVENAGEIKIRAHKYDKWYPYLIFYDKKLNILEHFHSQERVKNFSIAIPKNSQYLKISDNFTLDNIKRGLTIFLSER